MSAWTRDELIESFVNNPDIGASRVHRQQRVPFRGRPGHLYFITRRNPVLSDQDLAEITSHSHSAEVCLTRINTTYIVQIGNPGVATATLWIPTRADGIEEFSWIAHTHPLEQANQYQSVPRGATGADRYALRVVAARWGQTESRVVVCRRGRVEAVVPFRLEPELESGRGPDGRIWTPSR